MSTYSPPSNELVAELFNQAETEGRADLLEALAPFVELEKLIKIAKRQEGNVGPALLRALKRDSYTKNEIDELLSKAFDDNQTYLDAIVEHIAGTSDHGGRHFALIELLGRGFHAEALHIAKSCDSTKEVTEYLRQRIDRLSVTGDPHAASFSKLGVPYKLRKESAELFSLLDIDHHEGLVGQEVQYRYGENKKTYWSEDRYKATFDLVASTITKEHMKTPTLVSKPDGVRIIFGELIAAAIAERDRIQGLGAWHNEAFPEFYPVLFAPEEEEAVVLAGAIPMLPAAAMSSTPTRGFVDSAGLISEKQSFMAASFLPDEVIGALQKPGSFRLALIHHDKAREFNLNHQGDHAKLSAAMRLHRPLTPVMAKGDPADINEFKGMWRISTHLYLKGHPLWENDIYPSLLPHTLHEALQLYTPAEIEHINHHYNPERGESPHKMYIRQDKCSYSWQIERARSNFSEFKERFGFTPSIKLEVDEEFLLELAKAKLDLGPNVSISYPDNRPRVDFDIYRLEGTLGVTSKYTQDLPGLSMKALLAKAAKNINTKDLGQESLARTLGFIDRYPREEILKAITTVGQVKLAYKHLGLTEDEFETLPTKTKDAYYTGEAINTFGI